MMVTLDLVSAKQQKLESLIQSDIKMPYDQ